MSESITICGGSYLVLQTDPNSPVKQVPTSEINMNEYERVKTPDELRREKILPAGLYIRANENFRESELINLFEKRILVGLYVKTFNSMQEDDFFNKHNPDKPKQEKWIKVTHFELAGLWVEYVLDGGVTLKFSDLIEFHVVFDPRFAVKNSIPLIPGVKK